MAAIKNNNLQSTATIAKKQAKLYCFYLQSNNLSISGRAKSKSIAANRLIKKIYLLFAELDVTHITKG